MSEKYPKDATNVRYYIIRVSKRDIINMLQGVLPRKNEQSYINDNLGEYSDLKGWHWNIERLEKIDAMTLFDIYTTCKADMSKEMFNNQYLI